MSEENGKEIVLPFPSKYYSPSRQDPLERNEGIASDCINVIVLE